MLGAHGRSGVSSSNGTNSLLLHLLSAPTEHGMHQFNHANGCAARNRAMLPAQIGAGCSTYVPPASSTVFQQNLSQSLESLLADYEHGSVSFVQPTLSTLSDHVSSVSSVVPLPNSNSVNGLDVSNSTSLYVKNLSADTDELWLYQKFAPHGALLSCKVKTDPTTGHCRGVGFINYVDKASALRALQQLHGTPTPEGRQLHITLQAPRAIRAAAAVAALAASGAHDDTIIPTLPIVHNIMADALHQPAHLTSVFSGVQLAGYTADNVTYLYQSKDMGPLF